MTLETDLIGLGMVPAHASLLNANTLSDAPTRSVSTGLTATGTTIADGLALVSYVNILSTVAAGTGVLLPSTFPVGQIGFIQNNGANALNVFPHSASGTINGGSGGAAVTTAAAAGMIFFRTSSTDWGCYVLAKEA